MPIAAPWSPTTRGISRSTVDDPDEDAAPELIADDVHRVLSAVTAEPASVFGSSGGAVTGIAIALRHPERVRTLVVHEPSLVELLPDAPQLRDAVDAIPRSLRTEGRERRGRRSSR
jgi:clorobiocin biosynthesis protein CloN7